MHSDTLYVSVLVYLFPTVVLSMAAHTLVGTLVAAVGTAVAYTAVLVGTIATAVVATRAVRWTREVVSDG